MGDRAERDVCAMSMSVTNEARTTVHFFKTIFKIMMVKTLPTLMPTTQNNSNKRTFKTATIETYLNECCT